MFLHGLQIHRQAVNNSPVSQSFTQHWVSGATPNPLQHIPRIDSFCLRGFLYIYKSSVNVRYLKYCSRIPYKGEVKCSLANPYSNKTLVHLAYRSYNPYNIYNLVDLILFLRTPKYYHNITKEQR